MNDFYGKYWKVLFAKSSNNPIFHHIILKCDDSSKSQGEMDLDMALPHCGTFKVKLEKGAETSHIYQKYYQRIRAVRIFSFQT